MGQAESSEQRQHQTQELVSSTEASPAPRTSQAFPSVSIAPASPTPASPESKAITEKGKTSAAAGLPATKHSNCMLRWTASSLESLLEAENKLLVSGVSNDAFSFPMVWCSCLLQSVEYSCDYLRTTSVSSTPVTSYNHCSYQVFGENIVVSIDDSRLLLH